MEFHRLTWALVRGGKCPLFFLSPLCPVNHSRSNKETFCDIGLRSNNTREECLFTLMIPITSILESVCNVHSCKVCEVIWWVGGLFSCVLGTALVMQSDNSRKEVRVSAPSHSQGEAVCRCPVPPETRESLPCGAGFMAKLKSFLLSSYHEFNRPFDRICVYI